MPNPVPVVLARPCQRCGEEAIVQVVVTYTMKAGIRLEAVRAAGVSSGGRMMLTWASTSPTNG